MNEAFVIDREFLFKTSIHEITSMSLEHNFDINGVFCEGEFVISGDYKLHEISINKEDFSFKVPFSHEIKSNINLDTIELEVTDFSYDLINEDEVKVHIEYTINGEQSLIEFESEKELDEFLDNTNVEVVDLELRDNNKEDTSENLIVEEKIDENVVLDSINSEENYIKYHIHVVSANDSMESILLKYNTSLEEIKKYNSFDNLEINMKLIIPENEEN